MEVAVNTSSSNQDNKNQAKVAKDRLIDNTD